MAQAMEDYGTGVVDENAMNIRGISAYQDSAKWLDGMVAGMKADGYKVGDYGLSDDGMWVENTTEGAKYLKKKDVMQFGIDALRSNNQIQESMRDEAWAEARRQAGTGADIPKGAIEAIMAEKENRLVSAMMNKYGFHETTNTTSGKESTYGKAAAKKALKASTIITGTDQQLVHKTDIKNKEQWESEVKGGAKDEEIDIIDGLMASCVADSPGASRADSGPVHAYYDPQYLDTLPPGRATNKFKASIALVADAIKGTPGITADEIFKTLPEYDQNPDRRAQLEQAFEDTKKMREGGNALFVRDLNDGDLDFSAVLFPGDIQGAKLSKGATIDGAKKLMKAQAYTQRITDEWDNMQNAKSSSTGWSDDKVELAKIVKHSNGVDFGATSADEDMFIGNAEGEGGINMKGKNFNDFTIALRMVGEEEGSVAEHGNIKIEMGEDTMMNKGLKALTELLPGGLGFQEDDPLGNDEVFYKISITDPVTGEVTTTTTTEQASGSTTKIGKALAREREGYNNVQIAKNARNIEAKYLDRAKVVKEIQSSYTSQGVVDVWRDGVKQSIDTAPIMEAVETEILGHDRKDKPYVTWDETTNMDGLTFNGPDGEPATMTTLTKLVIEEYNLVDDPNPKGQGSAIDQAKKKLKIGRMHGVMDTGGGYHAPIGLLTFNISAGKSVSGSYTITANTIKGTQLPVAGLDAVTYGSSYVGMLSGAPVGQKIYNPNDPTQVIGFVSESHNNLSKFTMNGKLTDGDGNKITGKINREDLQKIMIPLREQAIKNGR